MIISDGREAHKSTHLTAEDMRQLEVSKSLIKMQIKSLIARDVWNTSEQYEILNAENTALKKAIELLGNNTEYTKLLSGK